MKAQLKLHNGTPTVFFDDQPVFFGCHLVGYMVADNLKQHIPFAKQYANAGVTIHSVDNFTHEWVGPRPGSPTPYDFTLVEQRMRTFLEANPNALFLMRVGVDTGWVPSNWFNEAYPDEVELLSNGVQRSASFASARWRQLVNQLLRDFIAHLRAIGLYDRCVAFQIGAGSSGEWIKDVGCMLEDTPDYSPAMRRHFQAWLRARYGTEAALQAAWADQAVTFGTAVVPTQPEQMTTVTGQSFRDFRREQKLIDFYECLAEVSADDLISYAETVRQETQSEKLVGGFFGYVMELSWNMAFFAGTQTISEAEVSTMQRSGHLGLRRLLRSPAIDFLVSPHAYAFRGLGGDGLAMQPTESLRAHGKIYFMEEDALMHNNFDPGGRNQSPENSIAVYQRNFANCLTHGHAVTWFETNELHEHPSIADEREHWMTRFQQLGRWAVNLDRTPSADVAVFLDDESYYYESNRNNVDLPLIWRQRVASLNRFGAPHDVYYLEDPEATVLGQVVYVLGRNKPGFGVKSFNAGTPQAYNSVYMASPDIPAAVLRGVARWAGVHMYNEDGDVLYATPELLSVHSVSGGPRHFTLPCPAEVIYDLFAGKVLGHNTDTFDVVLPPASTALYFAGKKSMLDVWIQIQST